MLTKTLGSWQIADNTCTATLTIDRPRSINISLEWSREPGPTVLPHIVGSALEAVERFGVMCEAIVDLIAAGDLCRIGIKDGRFIYAATDQDPPSRSSSAPAD